MDLDIKIKHAAIEALSELNITNTTFSDAIPDQASDRWSVHFKEETGRYYQVVIDTAEILSRFGTTDVDGIRKDIIRKLRARDPNNYMD